MKISQMKKILKEMKEICNYKDGETEIHVQSKNVDPIIYNEQVSIKTTINEIRVYLDKIIEEK